MRLVVLRSVLVYGGTVAAFAALARRFVMPVRWRTLALLAALPLLFTGRALLTGGVYAPLDIAYNAEPLAARRAAMGVGPTRNPLAVDVVSQMIPWRRAVRESLLSGHAPLWNPHVLAGEPLLAVQQPAVLYPGTWIGLLLPMPQAWTFDVTLRIFLALLYAFLFFRGIGAGEPEALLGACAWAFSDFLIFFVGYPVGPSVSTFPLLLLGLHRLVEDADRRAVGITTAALVLIAVAGHPETLLFAVAGGGVFFLFELRWAGRGRRLRPVLLSFLAGALALGLSAVVLLPFLEIVPQTWQHALRQATYAKARRSEPVVESLRRVLPSLMPYAFGALGKSRVVPRFMVPAGYAGSLLFPLAAVGLLSRWRWRWCFAALGFAGLAIGARSIGITDLLTALPVFDIAVTDYLIFLAIFALAAFAVEGLRRLRAGEGRRIFFVASIACVLLLVLLAAWRRGPLADLGMGAADRRERVLLQVVPVLAGLLVVPLFSKGWRASGAALASAVLMLFAAQRALEDHDTYPTLPERTFYPPLAFLDAIPRGEPVRMTALHWSFTPNIAALYGLEDVRGYEAMLLWPLVDTFPYWCILNPLYFNRVVDPTNPFLSFLNVEYVVTPPGYAPPEGWAVAGEDEGGRLLRNPHALARVFVPRHVGWTDSAEVQNYALATIRDYAGYGFVGEARPGPPEWRENGEARVRIVSYGGDRMRLAIDARDSTVVGTSIPAWRGWKLAIDGKPARLLPFNRAFLAFEVRPGHHDAVLRYLPDGFVYGAGFSLAAVAASLLLARIRPAPGAEAGPPGPAASPGATTPSPPTTRSRGPGPPRDGST
jgi:hypothetical protein